KRRRAKRSARQAFSELRSRHPAAEWIRFGLGSHLVRNVETSLSDGVGGRRRRRPQALDQPLPPKSGAAGLGERPLACVMRNEQRQRQHPTGDRKSTRLNSSHVKISYAVFCL